MAASTVTMKPSGLSVSPSDVIPTLAPTLRFALQSQRALSTASLFVVLRTYLIASQILLATQSVAFRSLVASSYVLAEVAAFWRMLCWSVWNSQPTRRLRKKVVFEFFTLILGSGNNFCLVVFWPGWWILGFIGLMTYICAGRK